MGNRLLKILTLDLVKVYGKQLSLDQLQQVLHFPSRRALKRAAATGQLLPIRVYQGNGTDAEKQPYVLSADIAGYLFENRKA